MIEKVKDIFKRDYSREEIINVMLYMVILVMPFIVNKYERPVYITGKIYFLLICGVIILFLLFSKKGDKFKFKIEHKISMLFLFSIFIATIFSSELQIAIFGSYDRGEGFIMYCVYIILFFAASRFLVVNKKMIIVMLIVANIMSIYSIIQFYGIDPIQQWALDTIIVSESIGTIGHRNFLSSYTCIFLFLSMSIYIFKGEKKYWIMSIPLFSALLCTLTRGGWLTFIIYSAIGLVFIIKRKDCLKRAIVIFITFIVAFSIIEVTSGNKITARADKSIIVSEDGEIHNSAGARLNILKVSFKAFIDSPFLGEGPDTLRFRLANDYPDEFTQHTIKYNETIDKAHNEYLEYAVSCGIGTLILYLLLVIMILKNLLKDIKRDSNKIIFLVVSGYLIQGFLNISVIMVAPIFWILLGYCIQLKYKNI